MEPTKEDLKGQLHRNNILKAVKHLMDSILFKDLQDEEELLMKQLTINEQKIQKIQ